MIVFSFLKNFVMYKNTKIVGIDISKDVLDCYSEEEGHFQLSNSLKGFKTLIKTYGKESHYVMESTGYYHVQLALFLSGESILVSVENALVIKRFIQMRLSKVKTDKSDCKQIYEYGLSQDLKLWTAPSTFQMESESLLSLLKFYDKQMVSIKTKIKGECSMGSPNKKVLESLKKTLKRYESEVGRLETELESKVSEMYGEELTLARSIPGIGVKTSLFLVIFTEGMRKFESSGQLCSYVGLTPVIRESGKSVRSRPRISKIGNGKLRRQLFMCSFNAMKYNVECKALYTRITSKGKSGKLALIAVCNKLLRQVFGVLKSGKKYQAHYLQNRA